MPSGEMVVIPAEEFRDALVNLSACHELLMRYTGPAETPLQNMMEEAICHLEAEAFGEFEYESNELFGIAGEIERMAQAKADEWLGKSKAPS